MLKRNTFLDSLVKYTHTQQAFPTPHTHTHRESISFMSLCASTSLPTWKNGTNQRIREAWETLQGVCLLCLCDSVCVCVQRGRRFALYMVLWLLIHFLFIKEKRRRKDGNGIPAGTLRCDSGMTTGSWSHFGI